jgi:hypothetical protein
VLCSVGVDDLAAVVYMVEGFWPVW